MSIISSFSLKLTANLHTSTACCTVSIPPAIPDSVDSSATDSLEKVDWERVRATLGNNGAPKMPGYHNGYGHPQTMSPETLSKVV